MGTGILIVVAAFLVICLMAILCREINKLVIKNERLMQHNQQLNDAVVNKAAKLAEAEKAWENMSAKQYNTEKERDYFEGTYHMYFMKYVHAFRSDMNRMDTINSYHKQIEELRMQKMAAEDKVRKLNDEVVLLSGMRYKVADLSAENDRLRKLLNKKKWL